MEAEREKTLQAQVGPGKPLRPILTSLNGDNTWLISFPRPKEDRESTHRVYYHIVFEPWLNGPTSYLSSWIIHLKQSQVPAVATPEAIRALIGQIEAAAATTKNPTSRPEQPKPDIDAIYLGFHYLDHLHEPTLRLFNPSIPVIATSEAVAIIKPWNHFSTILSISDFNTAAKSWRNGALHPGDPFPRWLTPLRLLGHHELNYVTAIIWTHPADPSSNTNGEDIHEAILQTPHSTKLDVGPLQAFLDSEPQTQKLALLHGLKESHAMGSMNTYGSAGGLALYRKIGGAKYWVLTHSSKLWYSGIFMRLAFVYDKPRTVQWALEQEAKVSDGETERKGGTPKVVEVVNGGCFVLV